MKIEKLDEELQNIVQELSQVTGVAKNTCKKEFELNDYNYNDTVISLEKYNFEEVKNESLDKDYKDLIIELSQVTHVKKSICADELSKNNYNYCDTIISLGNYKKDVTNNKKHGNKNKKNRKITYSKYMRKLKYEADQRLQHLSSLYSYIPVKNINRKKFKQINKYFRHISKDKIIGILPTTVLGSIKNGIVFTYSGIYIKNLMSKPKYYSYSENIDIYNLFLNNDLINTNQLRKYLTMAKKLQLKVDKNTKYGNNFRPIRKETEKVNTIEDIKNRGIALLGLDEYSDADINERFQGLLGKYDGNILKKKKRKEKCGIEKGDIIGISRGVYEHYGVYIGNKRVIHYTSESSDIGKTNKIIETNFEHFLRGGKEYFVFIFPDDISLLNSINNVMNKIYNGKILDKVFLPLDMINTKKYRLFEPHEVVKRAKSKLGENEYNLALNNCEHFAIWCKTGISECKQYFASHSFGGVKFSMKYDL